MFLPLYLALVAASHDGATMMHAPLPTLPGTALFSNIKTVLTEVCGDKWSTYLSDAAKQFYNGFTYRGWENNFCALPHLHWSILIFHLRNFVLHLYLQQ